MLAEARSDYDVAEVLWPDEDEGERADELAGDELDQLLIDEEDLEHYRRVHERLAKRDPDLPEWLEVEVVDGVQAELQPELPPELREDAASEPDERSPDDPTEAIAPEPFVAAAPIVLGDPIQAPLWGSFNAMIYALTRGLRGMLQSSLVQLLAIGTMAVCMLLLGTTTLLFLNAQAVATGWGIDVPVTVYMQPGVDPHTTTALRDKLAALPEVERAEHVTPEQALARLDEGVGEHAELLAGIDHAALPDTIELAFTPGTDTEFAEALAGRLQGMTGVDEVAVLGPWVHEAEAMLATLRWLAVGVAALVSLACLAIVWSTIRLGVFARRAEIDILRLVGGTSRFVRAPFLVEGVLQGVLGTALALAGLWLAFDLIRPFLEQGLALMFAAGSIRFFAPLELGLALGFGALLGLLGSRAAVARHAEA